MGTNNFEVGQKVFVNNGRSIRVSEVTAITPKGFIKVDDTLFKPDGFKRTSDAWDTTHITIATDEKIEELKKKIFIQKVTKALKNVSTITFEQAEEINKILNLDI